MKQYKLVIAYDGTGYVGWIQQKHYPSVVQTLQDAFVRVFKRRIVLLGASKTDSGVHALGQVAIFKTDITVESKNILFAWNNALPSSILIRSLEQDELFHPHYDVRQKVYYYHFFTQRPLPFIARYGVYIRNAFDKERFNEALQLYVGEHDFSAFYTGDDRNDAVCTIDLIRLEYIQRYKLYRVVIIGERFLRHMVRRIIGAALSVASRDRVAHTDIDIALKTGIMRAEFLTAPAKGLLLRKIIYGERR